ncbi:MAG: hypothetical protein FJY65_07380 [Calditrichaeota bacterium]|nr:hypothetical protein [Calditrichota bacterium]
MPETWVVSTQNPDVVDLKTVANSGNVIEVRDVADDALISLKASNIDGANSVAIEAAGQLKVTAVSANNPASKGIHVVNSSTNANAWALKAEGKTDLHGTILTRDQNDQFIDAAEERALRIGNQSPTTGVIIGRSGANGVQIHDNTHLTGNLSLIDGSLESGGAEDLHLRIGVTGDTDNVIISRTGLTTAVRGALTVGPNNAVGVINSGGTAESPQVLKIGNDMVTADVRISRAGQNIDMFARTKFNSNECVLNNAPNLADVNGAGLVFNANGHGEGPSIDFYTGGVLRGWVDALGWNNV